MKIDDAEKTKLVREIVKAIEDSISNSQRISDVVSKARAADIDIELLLDGTIKMTEWAFQENSPTVNPYCGRRISEQRLRGLANSRSQQVPTSVGIGTSVTLRESRDCTWTIRRSHPNRRTQAPDSGHPRLSSCPA
jgi:hypothetical protein